MSGTKPIVAKGCTRVSKSGKESCPRDVSFYGRRDQHGVGGCEIKKQQRTRMRGSGCPGEDTLCPASQPELENSFFYAVACRALTGRSPSTHEEVVGWLYASLRDRNPPVE